MEKVSLGDIVTVNDEKIGLNVKARVLKIVYNVISKRYEKIELGNFKNEYRLSKKQEIQKLVSNIRKIKN